MRAPKWLVVARNNYRVSTSRIREMRAHFPYLTIGLLAIYVAFIAPAIVNTFIDELIAFILSQVAVAAVQLMLFTIFIYFIILPITNTLKEIQTGQLEILLAAPIRPSDMLLGEFLGDMPFYAIVVVVIAGLFTAILNPLGLDPVQMAIIIMIFVITFFSALWIGKVAVALLRTKFGRSTRGKDIGKALSFVTALPMIAVMYAFMGGNLLKALADPVIGGAVRTVLGLLPSSWGAEVIIGFARKPGDIGAVGLGTLAGFGGLVAFFLVALWLGAKVADRAYSLEAFTFTASSVKLDGAFYGAIKKLGGGGSFGTLLESIFKDYGRRLENLSKIAYMIGLLVLMNLFLSEPEDPKWTLVMSTFLLPLLAAFVAGEVALRGKETLLIYRKTPHGVARFVKAKLVQSWLVVVPFVGAITAIITSLNPQASAALVLTNTALMVLYIVGIVAFILGLFLLNPAFSDKSPSYILNIMIVMQAIPIALFLIPMTFLNLGFTLTLCYVTIPLSCLLGITFLYLGKRKLERIE